MLKQRWLQRKQNPLSGALASITWLYIYWNHTFPKSSCSHHRKLYHVVALLIKGYFALSRLLVSNFLLFNVLFWSSIKKSWGPRFWSPGSWVLGLESQVPCPGSWVLGLGSLVSGPRPWVLGLGSWVLSSRFWVLILDYVIGQSGFCFQKFHNGEQNKSLWIRTTLSWVRKSNLG